MLWLFWLHSLKSSSLKCSPTTNPRTFCCSASHIGGKKYTFRILSVFSSSWCYCAHIYKDIFAVFLFPLLSIPRVTCTQFIEITDCQIQYLIYQRWIRHSRLKQQATFDVWTIHGFVPFTENDEWYLCENCFNWEQIFTQTLRRTRFWPGRRSSSLWAI